MSYHNISHTPITNAAVTAKANQGLYVAYEVQTTQITPNAF